MILYPIVALLISVSINLYITICSNPHLIYLNLSSDSNLTSRVYYDSGYGYQKQNYKVLKIKKNAKLKEYRIVFPFEEIKKFKLTNFNANSILEIHKGIRIYNNKNPDKISIFINHKNFKLINNESKNIKFYSVDNIIKIDTSKSINAFEINFDESLNSWSFTDFLTKQFYYNTLKLFLVFILIFYSVNLTTK